MSRLFVAIPVSRDIKESLVSFSQKYKNPQINWTKSKNFHITVQFLGEVEEKNIPGIIKDLNSIKNNTQPFSLNWKRLLWGPPQKEARMIWAALEESNEYNKLVNKVSKKLDKYTDKNLWGENIMRKKRTPHITIARFKNPKISKKINLEQEKIKNHIQEVNSFQLWQSFLKPSGAEYKIIEDFSFLVDN